MSLRGIAGGVLGLVALQTLVQPAAADKTAGLAGLVVTVMQRLLSDQVAGIPDRAADLGGSITVVGEVKNIPGAGPAGATSSARTTPSTSPGVKVNNGPNRAQ